MGPYLKTDDGKKHQVYIITLIDDASRLIVGIDVFFHGNFVNLMSVIKSAVAKYGRPQLFNFDNGRSYKTSRWNCLQPGSVLSSIMISHTPRHRRQKLSAGSAP